MSKALRSKVITLTIYGGAGAGKSTLAANLAAYLARYFPVMLVDLSVDDVHGAADLHGVELASNEPGVLQAWLAALDGAPQPPQPTVKPSAKVDDVYVMPPGPVAGDELQRKYGNPVKDAVFEEAAMELHSIIINQAKIHHTQLVIIDTPPWGVVPSDFAVARSDMALVVVRPPAVILDDMDELTEINILKHFPGYIRNLLSDKLTIVAVNQEDEPINIAAPFPVYHLPYSPEVDAYSRRDHIFIMYRPVIDHGYRWQIAFSELAETVARMARLMMNQLKGIDEVIVDLLKKYGNRR